MFVSKERTSLYGRVPNLLIMLSNVNNAKNDGLSKVRGLMLQNNHWHNYKNEIGIHIPVDKQKLYVYVRASLNSYIKILLTRIQRVFSRRGVISKLYKIFCWHKIQWIMFVSKDNYISLQFWCYFNLSLDFYGRFGE